MQKSDFLQKVARFHHTFKHPIASKPTIPSEKRCALRVALIMEELQELEAAVHKRDIVQIADALCDIQYVLCGAVLEFGLWQKFDALFEEVQRSNMSKACNSEKEALQTVAHYKNSKKTDCYFVKKENKWLVYRKKDDKTLKSVNYSPADIPAVLGVEEKNPVRTN